jgi:hypothetical protein
VFLEKTIPTSPGTLARNLETAPRSGESGIFARPVDPSACPEWDAKVTAHPDHSFFHRSAWARVLRQAYGFQPVYLALPATEPAGQAAMLPLMEVDSWLTGRRGVSLPFTDECQPLGCRESRRALVQAAMGWGAARGWSRAEFRGGTDWFDDAPPSQLFYGHRVALDAGDEKMLSAMDAATRRAIRKAEKNGVQVTVSRSGEAVRQFYSLHCRTRRKHGLPPQPFVFFRCIQQHVLAANLGVIVTASHAQRPIASSMFFQSGRQAIYKFGASDETCQTLRGSNLVMWEAMKWLARNGATSLHLGRTSLSNEGLRRFKLNWGATEETIEYVKYDFQQKRFVAETDGTTGWHNWFFRRLPLVASRLAGALLYRHWA